MLFLHESHQLPSMSASRRSNMLRLGTGAQCSVLLNYLCPSKMVKEIFPNFTKSGRMEGLVTVKRDTVVEAVPTNLSSFPILTSQVSSKQHVNMFVLTKRVIHLTSGVCLYLTVMMLL